MSRDHAVAMLVGIVLFVVGVLWAAAVWAQSGRHGDGHAQHHDEYRDWRTPAGGSCCSNQDCRPVRAYRDDSGLWRALIDGRWTIVPPTVVLGFTAKDGNSHICANAAGIILCFVGGVPKS